MKGSSLTADEKKSLRTSCKELMLKTTEEGSSISTDETAEGNVISDGTTTSTTVDGVTTKTQSLSLSLGDAEPESEDGITLPPVQPISDITITGVDDLSASTDVENITGVDDSTSSENGKNSVFANVDSTSSESSRRRRLGLRALSDDYESDNIAITVKLGVSDTSMENSDLKDRKFNCM